ncbi:MAG: hydantoinase/oxoprolinase family protein [Pikeienuella sp.]
MRVGIEVGGTFTDLVAIGPEGVTIAKTPSTPRAPDEGAMNALRESGLTVAAITELAHGSTIATNAVLERKGAKTAFVTTEGFRDILEMQRHGRDSVYDLRYRKPQPIVPREDCFGVAERVLADGAALAPLDEAEIRERLIPMLREGGYGSVAICLLNAYVNPAHEERLAQLLKQGLPGVFVAISSAIAREFREYERASTTALSAYVQPVVDSYIERFARNLGESGFRGNFSIMQSNGGRASAEGMRESAVTALLSGPAAGVVGAARQVSLSGFTDILTLDIGGTSTDVCAVREGKPQLTQEYAVDRLPIRVPVIDINTIGAGGGSIVWIDEGGMLRVGPRSAGADPGPACYGRGGEAPTITDAHVIRGTVRPEAFLGGRMALDTAAAKTAFAPIAAHFGMSVENAAESAIRLANANIVRAIQMISTERGLDPRDFALVPFGGGGPLHAAAVAEDLGVDTVVTPPSAGVISAYGLIASDFTQYSSLTRRARVGAETPEMLRTAFTEMRDAAERRMRDQGLSGPFAFEFVVAMRFVGQAFEVPVAFDAAELDALTEAAIRKRFGEEHHRVYFFGGETARPTEVVSFRLGASAPLAEWPTLRETGSKRSLKRAEAAIFLDGEWREGALVSRSELSRDTPLPGPAILEDPTSTTFLPAGWTAIRDGHDNTIMKRVKP